MVINKIFQKKKKSLLSEPVMKIPGKGNNYLTWAELFHGFGCFGNAGSGKSSGVLAHLLRAILTNKHRPGGLFICVKKDDRLRIEKAIREAERAEDMVIISAENPYKVNAIEYELFRNGRERVEYNQALDLIMEFFVLGENYQAGGGGGNEERYWDKQLRLCLLRLMMLLVLSEMPVTIQNMRKILVDSFDEDDLQRYAQIWSTIGNGNEDQQEEAIEKYEAWCNSNFFLQCFEKADARQDLLPSEKEIMTLVRDYFLKSWCKISEKTRAIIESSVFGLCEPFMTGILKTHFSDEMSKAVKPENCYKKGRLIIVDVPIKEYGISAIYAGGMVKKLFQLCVERRVIEEEINPRPCFLYMDEYHLTCSPTSDDRFQSSCRSTMTAAIYCTQSLNNIKVSMGKDSADSKTKSLLTNWGTQAFCGNFCRDTNVHASNLIGKKFINTNSSSFDTNNRGSQSTNEQLHYIVPPEHFTTLSCGGEDHGYLVESILVCRGKKWSTGESFFEAGFDQRGTSKSFFDRLKMFFL